MGTRSVWQLNGPGAAEGNLCPEGWTFYPLPGPAFAGRDGAAEGPYYTWVDQHDILGLGPNTPIGTGNFSDSLHVLTYQYCGQNLGCLIGNDAIVTKRFVIRAGFFQTLPVG